MFLLKITKIGMENADNTTTETGHYDQSILANVKVII